MNSRALCLRPPRIRAARAQGWVYRAVKVHNPRGAARAGSRRAPAYGTLLAVFPEGGCGTHTRTARTHSVRTQFSVQMVPAQNLSGAAAGECGMQPQTQNCLVMRPGVVFVTTLFGSPRWPCTPWSLNHAIARCLAARTCSPRRAAEPPPAGRLAVSTSAQESDPMVSEALE